jgi:hypothetical protein
MRISFTSTSNFQTPILDIFHFSCLDICIQSYNLISLIYSTLNIYYFHVCSSHELLEKKGWRKNDETGSKVIPLH